MESFTNFGNDQYKLNQNLQVINNMVYDVYNSISDKIISISVLN